MSETSLLTFGFLLPPHGEAVDLTDYPSFSGSSHLDYCEDYIKNKATVQEKQAYDKFCFEYWHFNFIKPSDPYIDFCIQVLGWCKIGNIFPKKVITYTGEANWHNQIYFKYHSNGYTFFKVPRIDLGV